MIPLMALLWVGLGLASDHWVVRKGDTVESVAAALGDPALAAAIRQSNHLEATQQPRVGDVLSLPVVAGATQEGLVLAVRGSGTVTLPGGASSAPLAPHMSLPEGSAVCTDAESFAMIRLARDTTGYAHDDISLLPNTCLTVLGASAQEGRRSSLINMSEGSISVTGTPNKPGDVIVTTPEGVATGEQGGFRVTLEQGATRAEAVSAPIAVMGAGAEVELEVKQGTRVKAGAAPEAPKSLLSAGALFLPEDGTALRWPDFRWASVPRALGYRVQVATSPDFAEIVHQVDVPFPEWQPDFLLLPTTAPAYWWRITPLDRFGFEGVPSVGRKLTVPAEVVP